TNRRFSDSEERDTCIVRTSVRTCRHRCSKRSEVAVHATELEVCEDAAHPEGDYAGTAQLLIERRRCVITMSVRTNLYATTDTNQLYVCGRPPIVLYSPGKRGYELVILGKMLREDSPCPFHRTKTGLNGGAIMRRL